MEAAARIVELERQLHWAQLRIQVLEEKLRLRRIQQLGPHSETLSDLQLALLADEEPGVTGEEVEAEAHREALQRTPSRERKPHPGRNALPEDLPRVVTTIPCSESNCAKCGEPTAVIGYDESEQLDVEPARYFVRVTKCEKRACRECSTVTAASLPERIVEKGLASNELVIETVVAKYCDHLPLYRQAAIMERETGVEIGRATLDGWVMRVGEMVVPIVGAMRRDLLAGRYLQADETPVPVQVKDGRGKDHQAYLWQYGKPGGETVFDFCMSRERDGPRKFLGEWEGILQTDGYVAYEGIGGPNLIHVGCWAHARRKFVHAVKVNPNDPAAAAMVIRMDALFVIDRDARRRALSPEARHAQRRELADEWLQEIHGACHALSALELPKSALGQAVAYTLNQWEKLRRCFAYPEVELSNNLAENSMRPIAIGRKNWLHVGSKDAGPKVAAILSISESCRRLGISAKEYFRAVLPGLAKRTLLEVADLTPARWLANKR